MSGWVGRFIYLINVFGGREEHRRLGQVAHGVELGALGRRVVQLVQLLAAGGRHFALGRSSLLVPCFPLGTLKHTKQDTVTN